MTHVGSCGTKHKRHEFTRCPGAYLRRPGSPHAFVVTAGPGESPFDKVWRAHWAYSHGHSIGSPPPSKLEQGVVLFEMELRARSVLVEEAREERRKKAARPDESRCRVVAVG